jgi:hypothetical protein
MKAVMNGVLNFSVLDGWWAEGYKPGAGWAMPEKRTYENQQFQDELDSETIYNILEDDIAPDFYARDKEGVPSRWVQYIKHSTAEICPDFTMKRMLDEYREKYYSRLAVRAVEIKADNCSMARQIADWKYKVHKHWHELTVRSVKVPDSTGRALRFGDLFKAEVKLNSGSLSPEDIGMEVIFGHKGNGRREELMFTRPLELKRATRDTITFSCEFPIEHAGLLDYAIRLYPTHPLLSSSHEMGLVKYI